MKMMSSEKPSKAGKIRAFMQANPSATAKEIAAGVGCDITYVYLVQSNDRRKNKPKKPTRGQELVRQVLSQDSDRIAKLDQERAVMHAEIARLHTIIDYLERKVRGASI
jgi:hypothetical protein